MKLFMDVYPMFLLTKILSTPDVHICVILPCVDESLSVD